MIRHDIKLPIPKRTLIGLYKLIIAIGFSLLINTVVFARNWQIMLVPESIEDAVAQSEQADLLPKSTLDSPPIIVAQKLSSALQRLNADYAHIENGLAMSLARSAETVIEPEKVLGSCERYLCGQSDITELMNTISNTAPNVHLVALYAFGGDKDNLTLYLRLLDPLSLQVLLSDSLRLLEQPNRSSLFALGQDMGMLVARKLSTIVPQQQFTLHFEDFLFDELNGLTTLVLANNQNTQLVLNESSTSYLFINRYFPLTSSEYTLRSSMSASQVKQMLATFFNKQQVPSAIHFSQTSQAKHANEKRAYMHFSIKREGQPYVPSIITRAFIILCFLVFIALIIRRHYLQRYLLACAKKRDADRWLRTYEKASFTPYGLRTKWASQYSYWRSLQKQSEQLAAKAKLYFDAGDINTSKLLVSKALHANTANKKANKLVKAIEALESASKALSDSEQKVRSQLAQAMSHYRQQQPIDALRLLYHAHELVRSETTLKKQSKAIGKLIKQVKKEAAQTCYALVITSDKDPTSLMMCANNTVHVGRRPVNDSDTWISNEDGVFYLNHKAISRIGRHGYIQKQASGFVWVDSSKNGSYINKTLIKAHQPYKLHNEDTLHLGGSDDLLSTRLDLSLNEQETILQLAVNIKPMTLLDKQTLNELWPDNSLATRTNLVCTQLKCCLVFDSVSEKMHICEIGKLPGDNAIKSSKSSEYSRYISVCNLLLGECSSVSPIDSKGKRAELFLDSQALLGEVPLFLPCEIRYAQYTFQLSDYDTQNIRYAAQATAINDAIRIIDTDDSKVNGS